LANAFFSGPGGAAHGTRCLNLYGGTIVCPNRHDYHPTAYVQAGWRADRVSTPRDRRRCAVRSAFICRPSNAMTVGLWSFASGHRTAVCSARCGLSVAPRRVPGPIT